MCYNFTIEFPLWGDCVEKVGNLYLAAVLVETPFQMRHRTEFCFQKADLREMHLQFFSGTNSPCGLFQQYGEVAPQRAAVGGRQVWAVIDVDAYDTNGCAAKFRSEPSLPIRLSAANGRLRVSRKRTETSQVLPRGSGRANLLMMRTCTKRREVALFYVRCKAEAVLPTNGCVRIY